MLPADITARRFKKPNGNLFWKAVLNPQGVGPLDLDVMIKRPGERVVHSLEVYLVWRR